MNVIKTTLVLCCIFLLSINLSSQEKMSDDIKGIFLPFKGGTLYDDRTEEDILKEIEKGHEPSTNLNIKFSDYFVTIYNYGVYESVIQYSNNNRPVYLDDEHSNQKIDVNVLAVNQCYLMPKQDTLYLNEWVFNDLSDKMLKITPNTKDKDVRFKLSARLAERIWQQKPRDMDYEEWEGIADDWKGVSPSITIKDSAKYYFRIPQIQKLSDFPELQKTVNLRDTLVVIEGEYDDVATIVYKDRPAHFIVDDVILRIDKYRKETLIETKYIRIVFSYGC